MNPFAFLIEILFSLYISALMLRFILQWVRADFYNPISQAIVKITNPVVAPLRRIIPGLWGLDFATLFVIVALGAIKYLLIGLINGGLNAALLSIVLVTSLDTIHLVFNIFTYAIIIQALLSWVAPDPRNPAIQLLSQITHPILRHFQKIIPPIGGLDLSVMAAIIFLLFLRTSFDWYAIPFINEIIA